MVAHRSSISSTFALFHIPFFAPVLLAILFAILAEAMAFSYIALLAVEKIGMGPLELGAFLGLSAASGIVATTVLGHLHDRRPVMWPLLMSLLAKVMAFAICALATDIWALLLNAALLFGISSASFALLFALARHCLDSHNEQTISRGMAALRMVSSLSWALGPALAAYLVAHWQLDAAYIGAASLAGLAMAVVLFSRIRVVMPTSPDRPEIAPAVMWSVAPPFAALVAFHTAMFTGSNATSIVIGQSLGSQGDVGLLVSVCAIIEVFIMGMFVFRPPQLASRGMLSLGFMIFATCFLLPALWPSLPVFYFAQLPRAAGIAIISVIGMAYLHQLLPGRPGLASALFGNSASAGLLLSGFGTGIWAKSFGYWSLFGVCGGLCGMSAGLLLALAPRRELVQGPGQPRR